MPVQFEQPDPYGFLSGPAQAGGYVAQYSADRQFALQAAALRNQSQGQQHSQMLQEQQLQSQAALQGAALQQRGQVSPAEQFQARQQNQMQAQQAANQQGMQQQHLQAQLAMQQQAAQLGPAMFTQADNMQLSKLQAALSDNASQRANGTRDGGEADAIDQQLQPRIQDLLHRQEMTQQRTRQRAAANGIQDAATGMATRMAAGQQLGKQLGWDEGQLGGWVNKDDHSLGWLQYDPGTGKTQHIGGAKGGAAAGKVARNSWEMPSDPATLKQIDEHTAKTDGEGNPVTRSPAELARARKEYWEEARPLQSRIDENDHLVKQFTDPKTGKLKGDVPPAVQEIITNNNRKLGLNDNGTMPEPDTSPPGTGLAGAALRRFGMGTGKAPGITGDQSDAQQYPPAGKVPGTDQPVPPGYRSDVNLPGFILPEHFQFGEHYVYGKDSEGNAIPKLRQPNPVTEGTRSLGERFQSGVPRAQERFHSGVKRIQEATGRFLDFMGTKIDIG
jgi:hypothetical protein